MRKILRLAGNCTGFTIIEILVVISITAVVGGISFAGFSAYSRQQKVEQVARDIKQIFEEARSNTINKKKPHRLLSGTDPKKCFNDFDKDGFPDPDEGSLASNQDLRAYFIRVNSVTRELRMYAYCSYSGGSSEVLMKKIILPSDISIILNTCGILPPLHGYLFEINTLDFYCNDLPATSNSIIRIQGPTSVQRTITIDRTGTNITISP